MEWRVVERESSVICIRRLSPGQPLEIVSCGCRCWVSCSFYRFNPLLGVLPTLTRRARIHSLIHQSFTHSCRPHAMHLKLFFLQLFITPRGRVKSRVRSRIRGYASTHILQFSYEMRTRNVLLFSQAFMRHKMQLIAVVVC